MIDGTFVKEMDERFRMPLEIGAAGFIAAPAGWSIYDPASLVKPGPTPDALKVYTLGALVDYVTANRDALALDKLVVHVVSPQIVRLVGPLSARERHRELYVESTATNLADKFTDVLMAHEAFVIGLQVRFAESDTRAAVLRLIGNIKSERVSTSSDDGVTQTVSAKNGVVLQAEAAVPNPVALSPFRTFREVLQPESLFVLRVNQGRAGELPSVGLFEADGGAWRLTAVDRVLDWLRLSLPESVAVLG